MIIIECIVCKNGFGSEELELGRCCGHSLVTRSPTAKELEEGKIKLKQKKKYLKLIKKHADNLGGKL